MKTKLDMYPYILNKIGKDVIVHILVDGTTDPVISDIVSELSQHPVAYVEGETFTPHIDTIKVVKSHDGKVYLLLEGRNVK